MFALPEIVSHYGHYMSLQTISKIAATFLTTGAMFQALRRSWTWMSRSESPDRRRTLWSSKVAKSMENPLSVGNCHNYPLPLLISGGCSWLQSHNHDTDKLGIVGIRGPYSYGLLAYELEPHPQAVAG